jgi:hypothetical protein
VETITASNINIANLSTGVITLPQLYTSFINIAPSNTVYISAPDLTINANATTDEGEDPLPNNLNLLASANINITIPNNNAYSINMSGEVYMSKNIYVSCNVVAPRISTNNINVSSINGQPIGGGGGGGGWVSTATTPLFMNDNPIIFNQNDGSTGLAYGSVAPYSVGVDGPYLFGNLQGAVGTTINGNDISLAWDTTQVDVYKTLRMNGDSIGDAGGFLTISSATVGIAGTDSVGLFAGNNSTFSVINITSTNIDLIASTVSRSLAGVSVPQPVIQYGTDGVSGNNGSVAITLGTPYTSSNSYTAFISMLDSIPAETSVSRDSDSQITLSWNSGGGGSHTLSWMTVGT